MKLVAQFAIPFTAIIFGACSMRAVSQATTFDGNWWMHADYSERSGFIDGFSDCAVWSAHNDSFNTTPEQIVDKITDHFQAHKSAVNQSLIAAWQSEAKGITPPKESAGGEKWKNPHWWLTGDWWQSENEELHGGYVEGYLYCTQTLLPGGSEHYSRHADYYTKNINSYLTAHKLAHKLAVASILQRFQDSNRKATS